MKVAINCLSLVNGEYSGVQAAVMGFVQSISGKASGELQLLLILRKGVELPFLLEQNNPYIKIVRPCSAFTGRLGRIWFETHGIDGLLKKHGVDILHNPTYLSCRTSVNQVCTVHDVFALQYPALCRRLNRWHYQRRLPVTLRNASGIITPTNAVRENILGLKHVKAFRDSLPRRLKAISWGIDEEFYNVTQEQCLNIKEKYNLPDKYVLFVGRQEPKKNIGGIMKTFFAAVCSTGLDYQLVCAGPEGWGGRDLGDEAESLGFEDRLHVCGFLPREDMPGLYAGARALLFPSFAEGFGLPVIEAMACGTPVVCSDIPALREIAADAAVLCHPGNLAQLREGLEKVLTDDKFAEQLRKKGASRAELFRWNAHVENIIAYYREIMRNRSYEFTAK